MAKLIVRRGKRPEYYQFLSVTAVANGDELIVDRRRRMGPVQDGPAKAETTDRRSPAARKWIDGDVIVVVEGQGLSPAR